MDVTCLLGRQPMGSWATTGQDLFNTEKERELCNCNGIRKPPLPPQKSAAPSQELFSIVQSPVGQQAAVWKSVTKALDAETRSKFSYKKRTVLGEKLISN